MNLSTVRKRRRKVIASTAARRKLNSTSNRSLSFLSLGNNKRRMTTLVKNNKTLAMALQDARCELSTKQMLLENATKNFKDIMQARISMLEIYSTLKCCMKRFDDTLQLLKVDDMKISDLTVPFQSCSKFKSKMKELAASVEKVSEEDSFSIEEEKNVYDNGIIKSSNQMISKIPHSSNIDCIPMEITEGFANKIRADIETFHDSSLLVSRENTSFVESRNIADIIDPIPLVLFCENSKGILDPCEGKQTSSAESDLLKDRESLGTPKLSISNIQPLINTKVSTNCETCLSYENCSSPVENPSKISNSPVLSSLKVWSSKIPRLQDIPVRAKESNLLRVIRKGKAPCQKTSNVAKESDINMCRRKTFVVKNSDISVANPESNVSLNEGGILNENSSNNAEDSDRMSRRKTFVVNNSDTSENEHKSLCDRRKTFVKKSDGKIKLLKLMKGKRNTFLSSEIEENCTNHSEYVTPVENSIDAINQKKLSLSRSEMKITEELPSICSNINEGTQNFNAFQKLVSSEISSDTRMIPSDIHTKEHQFQDKRKKEANEIAQKMKESKPEKGNSNVIDEKENLFKAEKLIERVLICNSIDQKNEYEISNIGGTCQSNLRHVIQSDDNDIQFLSNDENMNGMKMHTRDSYEKFLESSNCESIPDLDFQSFKQESSIKSIPIRRKISGSKQKKVFVFNTHKRKSVPGKKSVEKLPPNSEKHSKYFNVCNEVPQSDSTSTKSQDDNISTVKNVNRKKAKKNVSFDITSKVCISETVSNAQSDICCGGQEMLQITTIDGKNMETSGNVKKQDNFTSESIVSNSEENMNENISPHINYSPVIMSGKFLNTIELESNNLDLKSKNSCKKHGAINSLSNETKSKIRKCKSSKVKRYSLNGGIPIDAISVKKNTKRNNSKKQSKKIIASDLEEENMIDLLTRNKNEVKTRKQSKGKSRKKTQVSMSENNIIVVEAEVHPPPHFLKIPETEVLNKENKETPGAENFQVSVVLNDIFQSKNIDVLTLSCKDKLVSEGRTSKIPLSDNSRNILALTEDSLNSENEGSIANNFEEIKTTKRTRARNYAEPSLRKKLRR